MRKILILGGGIYQVPLIRRAKELGLETLVASIPGRYPGLALADRVLEIDTTDREGILRAAREEGVAGVCVCGTDVAVPAQGYVCDRLGLKGPSLEPALRAQDKTRMKEAFVRGGVRTARYVQVPLSRRHPADVCGELGYPVIFKAADSSGSRGITRVDGEADIDRAYASVRGATHTDHYLVEEFLTGDEFGAQAFVLDGELQFILPHGDYVFHGDTGVPIGHYAPFEAPDALIQDCEEQLRRAVRALGIDNCAVNADFILSRGKTYVLEIGARAGATCLVEMTECYYGFDYYGKILETAMGGHPSFRPENERRQPTACMLFRSDRAGTITAIENHAPKDPRVVNLSFDCAVGDTVRKFHNGPDRIGQIVAVGDTAAQAKAVIDRTMAAIRIAVE